LILEIKFSCLLSELPAFLNEARRVVIASSSASLDEVHSADSRHGAVFDPELVASVGSSPVSSANAVVMVSVDVLLRPAVVIVIELVMAPSNVLTEVVHASDDAPASSVVSLLDEIHSAVAEPELWAASASDSSSFPSSADVADVVGVAVVLRRAIVTVVCPVTVVCVNVVLRKLRSVASPLSSLDEVQSADSRHDPVTDSELVLLSAVREVSSSVLSLNADDVTGADASVIRRPSAVFEELVPVPNHVSDVVVPVADDDPVSAASTETALGEVHSAGSRHDAVSDSELVSSSVLDSVP
jgi:hypothetical protein